MDDKETALTPVEQKRVKANREFTKKQETKRSEQVKSQESKVKDVDGNEITSKILERHGISTTTQDDKKGDQATKPAEDIKQVEELESELSITDQEFEALDKAGVKEEDLDGKTIEEIKTLAQDSIKPQEKKKVSQEPIIITEAMASKFGFAKNLVGKTMDDAFQVIDNQNVYNTSNELKIVELERKLEASNNKQNIKTEEVQKLEPIDFINLTPEEQAKKLDERIGIVAERTKVDTKAIVQEAIKELLPSLEPLQKQSEKAAVQEFYTSLAERLPEEIKTPKDAKKVMDAWNIATKDKYTKDDLMALAGTPNAMIDLVSTHYILNNAKAEIKETKENTDKVIKKQTYDKVRKLLKNSRKLGSGTTFNFKRTESEDKGLLSEEGSDSEQMIGNIIARNLPR